MSSRRRRSVVALVTLVGLSVPLACTDDSDHTEMAAISGTPSDTSPEAGFARDMSTHHAQAVAMAEAIRDRTEDPDLKLLATDIALGQQGQIGRMSGWLDEWGLSISSTNAPMAWITDDSGDDSGHDGMDMGDGGTATGTGTDDASHLDPETGLMPGMATRPQKFVLPPNTRARTHE